MFQFSEKKLFKFKKRSVEKGQQLRKWFFFMVIRKWRKQMLLTVICLGKLSFLYQVQ